MSAEPEEEVDPEDVAKQGNSGKSQSSQNADQVQQRVLSLWEDSETRDPTDPYRVLGVAPSDSMAEIESKYASRLAQCTIEGGVEEGASRLLLSRLERARALLLDSESRRALDESRGERIRRREWAKLRYANGVYEGSIAPDSLEEGSQPIRSGKGVTVQASGEKYEGEYAENMKQGVGLCFWKNGDLYLGEFDSDRMSGQGCYYYGNGCQYAGDFFCGRRHGTGVQDWVDGSMYTGEFVEGQRSGRGVLELPHNAEGLPSGTYDGQWEGGYLHGHGRYVTPEGVRYEGQFQGNCFHGEGQLQLPGEDVYKGEFRNGRRHGKGAYTWADGDEYAGPFSGNHRHGHGQYVSSSRGFEYDGEWQANMLQGSGTLRQRVATEEGQQGALTYAGQWDGSSREGQGEVLWPSGAKYGGHFRGDKPHGTGVFTWPDGSTWDGTFVFGRREGAGTFERPPEGEESVSAAATGQT